MERTGTLTRIKTSIISDLLWPLWTCFHFISLLCIQRKMCRRHVNFFLLAYKLEELKSTTKLDVPCLYMHYVSMHLSFTPIILLLVIFNLVRGTTTRNSTITMVVSINILHSLLITASTKNICILHVMYACNNNNTSFFISRIIHLWK